MAGLMDVNILKPELAGSFEAGYRGAEQARQQSEMNQLKLDQLKQDRAMLTELQTKLRAAGQSDDPNQFFRAMIQTGNPDYMAKGYEGLQRYKELQRAEQLLAGEFGGAPAPANALVGGAAPAAAGAPTGGLAGMTFGGQVGPAPAGLKVSPEDKAYQQAADQWMMGGMQGPAPTRAGAAPANALAPAPGAETAPANAMVAAPDRVQELRRKIMQYRSVNDPRLKAMADQYENELKELTKTHTVGGRIVSGAGNVLYTAPTEMGALEQEIETLRASGAPANDPRIVARQNKITKLSTHAPGTTVNLPPQEKAFESELGKGQAERIIKSQAAAQDAAQILQTNQVGRDILKSGAITGAGANFFVGLNNALKQGGVDFGYADAAANSQAYAAAMAQNVGKLIKQYGAGTGLSDADRDFATQAAGGKINLDEKAIRKILDINDRAANFVIDRHNKDVKGIKTNIPLAVEKPVFEQQRPPAAAQIPGQGAAPAAIPQAAIDALKSGRGTDAQFDEIFGPGAAKRVRGGK